MDNLCATPPTDIVSELRGIWPKILYKWQKKKVQIVSYIDSKRT